MRVPMALSRPSKPCVIGVLRSTIPCQHRWCVRRGRPLLPAVRGPPSGVQREEQTVFTRFSRLQRTRRYRGSLILFAKSAHDQDHSSQLWCATEETFKKCTRVLSVMKLTDTNEVLYSFYRAIGGQPLNPLTWTFSSTWTFDKTRSWTISYLTSSKT
jgi:hypothetical protein